MDVLAVREATRFALDYARAGNGPLFMDIATYRYMGHSMSDPGTSYRSREEIAEVRKTRDPITGFKDRIITAGLVKEDEIKQIDKEVRAEVDAGAELAHTDGVVDAAALYTVVYYNTPAMVIRGATVDHCVQQQKVHTKELL